MKSIEEIRAERKMSRKNNSKYNYSVVLDEVMASRLESMALEQGRTISAVIRALISTGLSTIHQNSK